MHHPFKTLDEKLIKQGDARLNAWKKRKRAELQLSNTTWWSRLMRRLTPLQFLHLIEILRSQRQPRQQPNGNQEH
jgi:hypothetical protein